MELNNVIFFIGAGCSKDAGFPLSNDMVKDVEDFITKDWKDYRELYFLIKSCIFYSEGIQGNFNKEFNIEDLLLVINELEKKDRNPIYPFIGSWNSKLQELAGKDFCNIKDFKELIRGKLIEWVRKDDYSKAEYYRGFAKFKNEYGYPMRIFSLNYDLCIEQILQNELNLELGFDKSSRIWKHEIISEAENNGTDILLYKMHGSIDWKRNDDEGTVQHCAHPSTIPQEVIFGTDIKLKSIDPYLFYVSQFRQFSLLKECSLIVCIGYSFSDEYLNVIIGQSLKADKNRKILVVEPSQINNKAETERRKKEIADKIKIKNNAQIEIINNTAKTFLEDTISVKNLEKYISVSNDNPF
jgi:hypothetical protein